MFDDASEMRDADEGALHLSSSHHRHLSMTTIGHRELDQCIKHHLDRCLRTIKVIVRSVSRIISLLGFIIIKHDISTIRIS